MLIVSTETLRGAVSAYRTKPENPLGSPLHAILHDDDLSDASIIWCRKNAEAEGDVEGMALADMLMTFPQEVREEALHPAWLKQIPKEESKEHDQSNRTIDAGINS
jgi:hypothetical protein